MSGTGDDSWRKGRALRKPDKIQAKRRKRAGRGGPRPGAGAKPSGQPRRITRGLRWDPALLPQLDAWAERHGLDFTATVHEACRRLLRDRCDLLGPHEGAVTAHTIDGEVLLLCERHAQKEDGQ